MDSSWKWDNTMNPFFVEDYRKERSLKEKEKNLMKDLRVPKTNTQMISTSRSYSQPPRRTQNKEKYKEVIIETSFPPPKTEENNDKKYLVINQFDGTRRKSEDPSMMSSKYENTTRRSLSAQPSSRSSTPSDGRRSLSKSVRDIFRSVTITSTTVKPFKKSEENEKTTRDSEMENRQIHDNRSMIGFINESSEHRRRRKEKERRKIERKQEATRQSTISDKGKVEDQMVTNTRANRLHYKSTTRK